MVRFQNADGQVVHAEPGTKSYRIFRRSARWEAIDPLPPEPDEEQDSEPASEPVTAAEPPHEAPAEEPEQPEEGDDGLRDAG